MMLSSKALTELLSKNSDERLCKRWFLMTMNGTLLAYTQPTNIKELRKQAAMAAISWQEHQAAANTETSDAAGDSSKVAVPSLLQTLTMETEDSNIIVRKIQPQLLLVLEGGVPPRKRTFEPRVTPENPTDNPYPSANGSDIEAKVGSSASSVAESTRSSAGQTILGLQRRKLDALAAAIAKDFDKTGFKMPEEGSTKFF